LNSNNSKRNGKLALGSLNDYEHNVADLKLWRNGVIQLLEKDEAHTDSQ